LKYKEYISNITDQLSKNPERFWTLLKDRSKSKCSPSILTHKGQDITDSNKKSGIFNTYFHSVFGNTSHTTLPPINSYEDPDLENVTILHYPP